jgi:hypothetical protein
LGGVETYQMGLILFTSGGIRILDPRIVSQVFYQFATLAGQFVGVTSSHA